ncbi:hypothetical protein Ahy_B01g056362 [Arachis hypogaea]|uniref:PB1-like domain-containing protein n=1 Tax=Arachis hypogaea TaxID=3818 RepID=A0A445AYQ9_ARAHY|nr:hypothetical protein Ahy_B01g056362 [Arachis hypogaea]
MCDCINRTDFSGRLWLWSIAVFLAFIHIVGKPGFSERVRVMMKIVEEKIHEWREEALPIFKRRLLGALLEFSAQELQVQMGDPLITIIFHHGGSFITEADGSMSYNGGETCELPDIDTDTLDVFFVRDYHKKIGYDKVSQTWWLVPNRPMQTGLRAIADDNELMEMCYLAQQNKGVIHVYYEHGVSEPVYIEEAEPVVSGKELMLIPTIILTPKPTTNVTTEPIPSTTPCNPTSEPKILLNPQNQRSHLPHWLLNVKIAAAASGRRPLTRAAAIGNIARTTGKGKHPKTAFVALSSSEGSLDSHDSDDSAEDEAYRPGSDEVSSEEDLPPDRSAGKSNVKLRSRPGKKLTKGKKSVMVEEDGPVCADSDSEDDEIIFGPISKFGSSVAPYHDVQDDPYNDSDGGDSWHSEEMKTPPNSEDELEEVDSDDVFPAFREGGRFGELRLEVRMTFTTKMEFKEAVREYCIQEGRRIWFKKNDNVRMRAVCKDASCG